MCVEELGLHVSCAKEVLEFRRGVEVFLTMEDQGFNSSPQSSMEQEGKRSADLAKNEASRTGDQVEETAEQMRDQSAESAQSWRELVQSKVQPIVNHPYVRKSSEILNSGATQMKPLVGRTTETISSKFQPVVGKATETLQLGRDTAKKIYNKEEGYEPSKVAPYFAGSLGVLLLCMLLAGWSFCAQNLCRFFNICVEFSQSPTDASFSTENLPLLDMSWEDVSASGSRSTETAIQLRRLI